MSNAVSNHNYTENAARIAVQSIRTSPEHPPSLTLASRRIYSSHGLDSRDAEQSRHVQPSPVPFRGLVDHTSPATFCHDLVRRCDCKQHFSQSVLTHGAIDVSQHRASNNQAAVVVLTSSSYLSMQSVAFAQLQTKRLLQRMLETIAA